MQLHQLRAIVAVADNGSISAAARALGLSQPALTRALKQLEVAVSATLLVRSASGVTLTPAGSALLGHARRIVSEARQAHEQVAQLMGEQSGTVSLATSASAAALVVPKALELMRRRFPDVYVRVFESVYPSVMNLFRESEIDFAIGPIPAAGLGDDFRCDPMFDLELLIVVKQGHRKARAKSLADLAELDWIVTGPLSGPGAIHQKAFEDAGLPMPRLAMHCDSVGSSMQIIQHSEVASFVPRPIAEAAEASGTAQIVRVKERFQPLRISMYRPAQNILTPAGQALYSAIRTVSNTVPKFRAQDGKGQETPAAAKRTVKAASKTAGKA